MKLIDYFHSSASFHQTVKPLPDIETAKRKALDVLSETLGRCGTLLEHQWVGRDAGTPSDPGYDLKLRYEAGKGPGRGQIWWIHVVIKTIVHPKQASHAIWALKKSLGNTVGGDPVYPILIAPFISNSVAARCEEEQIGHLDLSGNGNVEIGSVWIERHGRPRKYKEVRSQKSLYTPKASRILRVLLQGPLKSHKVEKLAKAAGVSLGLVSKVRQILLDEELAEDGKEGIRIKGSIGARTILRDWLLEDDFSKRTQIKDYSILVSDSALAEKLVNFCQTENSLSEKGPLFTLNFAAWLRAPHNVPTTVSAYLDHFPDESDFLPSLQGRPVSRGAGNLRIIVPSDYKAVTIGRQHVKHHPAFSLVSDLQIFLDLHGGEPNGPEQANVLRDHEDFNGGWS
tara:strand:+ start:363 stop:1556 length:1194 start_codon:yes stop_codon:yes gene_type:complete